MARKHLKILALVLAAMMLLSACGGSSGAETPAPADSGAKPAESSQSTQASQPAAPAAPAASGPKHLNAAIYWTAATIDPAVDYDGWTSCRAGITETLVWVNENLELKPLLADSWTQPDPSTWVMHIRDGVTFHNGNAVDAAACKASLERTMEINSRAVTTAKIESIEADGQNLTIHTSEPFGAFLFCLSEPLYSIIDVNDPADPATNPVGTGPFKSVALQAGQIDMGQRIGAADIETLKNDSDYAVYEASGTRLQVLALNHTNQFLSDVNVRKALACCINYDAMVAITGGLYAVAGAPYPASAPYGYDQLDRQHYDLEAAKKCLADAGFADSDGNGYLEKNGKELAFTLGYADKSLATALEAVQSMAKAVGIKLTLQPVDTEPDLNEDNFEIFAKNWQSLSTGDPQWMLDNMYKTGGVSNAAQYSNATVDALCDELTGAFEFADRQRITIAAEEQILTDCVHVYLFSKNNFVMANNKVSGVTVFPIDYYFLTNTIDING